jgi:hypothetical protein
LVEKGFFPLPLSRVGDWQSQNLKAAIAALAFREQSSYAPFSRITKNWKAVFAPIIEQSEFISKTMPELIEYRKVVSVMQNQLAEEYRIVNSALDPIRPQLSQIAQIQRDLSRLMLSELTNVGILPSTESE